MDNENHETSFYIVWEAGLKGSTSEQIEASTAMKAKEAYARKWSLSVSNLIAEEIVPAL